MRRGPPNRGEDEPPPELHSIHRGKVASIKDYGVFVEMEGRRRHGLVHISQVSGSRIEAEDLPTIVEVGEAVWVKVISLADGKVSLSMKYVSQTSGEDLDANNVELEQNAQRRKPRPGEAKRIELGAILPTICTKCGAGGHLAAECYSTGGQKYDLIPEPEGGDEPPPPEPVGQISDLKQALKILARANKDEKRKKRKHKKDKKDKKDKRDSKRHKKEKKDKKDKKDRHHKDRRSRHSDYSD